VKTQISAAVSVYIFASIIKMRFGIGASLHTILQSLGLFEKIRIDQLLLMRLHKTSTIETITY
jgi:hypothetical protein